MDRAKLKRSIELSGRKTSVSLEEQFWESLRDIAREGGVKLSELVTLLDNNRSHQNLSSAIRVFVLMHYQEVAKRRFLVEPGENASHA